MIAADQFRRTEKILHGYRLNCARLEHLRVEIEELRHAGDVRLQRAYVGGDKQFKSCRYLCSEDTNSRA